jgi:hypothetical protein
MAPFLLPPISLEAGAAGHEDDVGDRLEKLEREEEIDRMLAEMKTRRGMAN